jgi:hypothetical protein
MKLKINSKELALTLGVAQFAIVDVDTKQGVPVVREWRNRIKDSEIDSCVSVVETQTKSATGAKS